MDSGTANILSPGGTRLAPAGVRWDAIKVGRFHALRALEHLEHPGAVAVDPAPAEPVLYFFVPAGSAERWETPQTTALGIATHIMLPPDHKSSPPGPYWLVPPSRDRFLTQTNTLALALAAGMESQGQSDAPDARAVDVTLGRGTARRLLDDVQDPSGDELKDVSLLLHGHLSLLVLEVEQRTRLLPEDSVAREAALAGVGEAQRRLEEPVPGAAQPTARKYAQDLARSVEALCTHLDHLGANENR
ncbi:DUF6415 family natural product biosynthesis protein [Streptomyces sp. NPDC021622]|uniref:DUF6415 family natural product biosynthesis protein n=1 Tax=Streptomyces sp. NPDC021622 TaxID=3155013 RepID=UPI0033D5B696